MNTQEVARLMGTYLSDNGATINRFHGQEAAGLLSDLIEKLEDRFRKEQPFQALWKEFQQDPRANEERMIAALDALEDRDQEIDSLLSNFFEAYRYGMDNELPVLRSDLVDEEDSQPYVRDLDDDERVL